MPGRSGIAVEGAGSHGSPPCSPEQQGRRETTAQGHHSRVKPFLNALGQVSVENATLEDTYDNIDPGAEDGPIIAPGLPLGNYNGVP